MSRTSPSRAAAEPAIRVVGPELDVGPVEARWTARVVGPGSELRELWFSVPAERSWLLAPTLDAALVGLLIPAMHAGADLELEGLLSPQLLAAAAGPVQDLLTRAVPGLRRVAVTAAGDPAPVPPPTWSRGVGIGFSGGVDSLHAVLDPMAPARPDHLIMNNVGSHGVHGREAFHARCAGAGRAAEELRTPLVPVDSDLEDFYRLGFLVTHPMRNVAVAHALSGGLEQYLVASTGTRAADGGTVEDLASMDEELLPLLASERIRIRSAGSEVTRFEKIRLLARDPIAQRHLDVCVKSRVRAGNCSSCRKCVRTMIALELLGHLDDFTEVFDLRRYRLLRPLVAANLWATLDSPLVDDLLDTARRQRFGPVLRARRLRLAARAASFLWSAVLRGFALLPPVVRDGLRRLWSRV